MRTAKFLIWFTLTLVLGGGNAVGTITSLRSLVELQHEADLIVVGSSGDVSESGTVVSFSITVSRVVKGDGSLVGTSLPVQWSAPVMLFPFAQGVAPPAYSATPATGLWFLQRSPSGWTLLPIVSNAPALEETLIPLPSGSVASAYAYASSDSLTDKVASEVCFGLESTDAGRRFSEYYLGLLDDLRSAVVTKFYDRMASSEVPKQRLLGLSGLIRGGDSSALQASIASVSLLDANSFEGFALLNSITHYFRASDQKSVSTLAQIATNAQLPAEYREAAAQALALIHTLGALPALASLLDDADANLRAEGVGGLASFANGLPIQMPADTPSLRFLQMPESAPYQTPETKDHFALGSAALQYLSFWKTWWANNRNTLTPTTP